MNTVARYASLVRFAHSIFALPFALVGYTWGLVSTPVPFDGTLLFKVLLCMVLARNTAMGFNRWADRFIDAHNPRTAGRDLPAGRISPREALLFTVVNAAGFGLVAVWINPLTAALAPVALAVLLGYSYCKRFTAAAHLVLGLALGIAPMGAYIAVTGVWSWNVAILSLGVLCWAAGFDIIYALQDVAVDREQHLRSIPARLGVRRALAVSVLLHAVTTVAVIAFGLATRGHAWYWTGAALFTALLVLQHVLVTPERQCRIPIAFGTVNGMASLFYAAAVIVGMLVGGR